MWRFMARAILQVQPPTIIPCKFHKTFSVHPLKTNLPARAGCWVVSRGYSTRYALHPQFVLEHVPLRIGIVAADFYLR